MREINKIIIHSSATPEGEEYTELDINRWHMERGFKEIGYHFVILLNGVIKKGRSIEEVGAHTKNFNTGSIGICYIGGLNKYGEPENTMTAEQENSLKILLYCLQLFFDVPTYSIYGHNDFGSTSCPSFNVKDWVKKNLK